MLLRWNRDFDRGWGWADELLHEMEERLAGRAPGGLGRLSPREPAFHVADTGGAFVVVGLVPGLAQDDIEIQATETGLTIRGERTVKLPEGYRAHRQERGGYRSSRSFRLGTRVDVEQSRATVKDGVLAVELRKLPESLPKSIAVKAS